MPALQVRDFPQDLYDELRDYAERNHRSIAQQTIACVESEIRRSKAMAERGAENGYTEKSIPAAIHEAAMRARSVDPFEWTGAFQVAGEEAREVRRAKWEELRKLFDDLAEHWNGPVPTCDELAQTVREDRDARTDGIIMNVEGFLAAEGRG